MHHDNEAEHAAKDEPSKEIEEEVRKHPNDQDAQVDLGSDESMDASDPISATRGRDDKPHPNSDAPKK